MIRNTKNQVEMKTKCRNKKAVHKKTKKLFPE